MFLIASWTQESFSNKIQVFGEVISSIKSCHQQYPNPLCYPPDSREVTLNLCLGHGLLWKFDESY